MKSIQLSSSHAAPFNSLRLLARATRETSPRICRTLTLVLTVICCAASFASRAEATTIIAPTVDEMAIEADAVIVGTVESVEVELTESRTERVVSILVSEVWKADCGDEITCPMVSSTLVLRAPGGRGTEYATRVFGAENYAVGEEVLIFLQYRANSDAAHSSDTAWYSQVLAWTKFTLISGDSLETRAVRDTEGITPVVRKADGNLEEFQTPAINDFSLDELRRAVGSAWNASERGE